MADFWSAREKAQDGSLSSAEFGETGAIEIKCSKTQGERKYAGRTEGNKQLKEGGHAGIFQNERVLAKRAA